MISVRNAREVVGMDALRFSVSATVSLVIVTPLSMAIELSRKGARDAKSSQISVKNAEPSQSRLAEGSVSVGPPPILPSLALAAPSVVSCLRVEMVDLDRARDPSEEGGWTVVLKARFKIREIRFRSAAIRNLISRVLGPRPLGEDTVLPGENSGNESVEFGSGSDPCRSTESVIIRGPLRWVSASPRDVMRCLGVLRVFAVQSFDAS